jgi:hypothetical protein
MNNDYNIFWGIIFIYFLGLFLCVMIPSEANAVTEVNTTTNSESDVKSKGRTVVISPPPSAISPSIGSSSSDICTSGVSGAIQTQILGVSTGETVRDENCERLKISKTLYDMGMKVAAVSVLCQDRRVYDAMGMAGTPCPFLGEIGTAAAKKWVLNPELIPEPIILETKQDVRERQGWIASGIVTLAMLLFLL